MRFSILGFDSMSNYQLDQNRDNDSDTDDFELVGNDDNTPRRTMNTRVLSVQNEQTINNPSTSVSSNQNAIVVIATTK